MSTPPPLASFRSGSVVGPREFKYQQSSVSAAARRAPSPLRAPEPFVSTRHERFVYKPPPEAASALHRLSQSPRFASPCRQPLLKRLPNFPSALRPTAAVAPTIASASDSSECLTGELTVMPRELQATYLLVPGVPELGRGAFARIRRIRLRQKDALAPRIEFALKTVDKSQLFVRGLLAQAKQEVELQMQASSHPNILAMIDFYEETHFIHHILEYCPGYTLAHYRPPFPDNLGRAILSQVSSALAFLHITIRCLHRDISPGNVLVQAVTPWLVLKLADFGWAVCVGDSCVSGKAGTESFMAPEVRENKPYSFPADIYSLGRVLSYCVNSKLPPFSDKLQVHLTRDHKFMLNLDPSLRPTAEALAAMYTDYQVSGAALNN